MTILLVTTLVYNLQIYEQRDEPIIRTRPALKELVATITGDPEYTINTVLLTFHSIGRLLKLTPTILTGRYSHLDQRRDTTVKKHMIEYTRAIPETLTSLGTIKNTDTVTLEIRRREDVLVAEVLHRGPYDQIPQAIEAMLQSIDTRRLSSDWLVRRGLYCFRENRARSAKVRDASASEHRTEKRHKLRFKGLKQTSVSSARLDLCIITLSQ